MNRKAKIVVFLVSSMLATTGWTGPKDRAKPPKEHPAKEERIGLGSGAAIGGVGLVLILGLGMILLGIVFMVLQRAKDPAYFRGETLVKDTPALIVEG